MKVLYMQSSEDNISRYNIKNCCLKEIVHRRDYKKTTLKSHCHTEYEIHMVFCGKQCYEADGVLYEVNENEFIIIPPKTKHRMVSAAENLLKYSITFNYDGELCDLIYHGAITDAVSNSINFVSEEFRQRKKSSFLLIENRVLEVLILLQRIMGNREDSENAEINSGNTRLNLAKNFILDNIERSLTVSDVASYCHLSARQLTRIFIDAEGISPAQYINKEKMERVGECIKNSDLSLRQISEKFSYNNQYYFNTAFKKYFGMPPLAYRKMFR